MLLQTALTDLIVLLCSAYALWTLVLPAAARRRASQALLRLPLPGGVKQRLQRWTQTSAAGGCAGCAKAAPLPPRDTAQPIRVVRRRSN